jgi:hypothetical protein
MDFSKLITELQEKVGIDKATAEKIIPVVTDFFKANQEKMMGFLKESDANNDGKPDSLMEKAGGMIGGIFGGDKKS